MPQRTDGSRVVNVDVDVDDGVGGVGGGADVCVPGAAPLGTVVAAVAAAVAVAAAAAAAADDGTAGKPSSFEG